MKHFIVNSQETLRSLTARLELERPTRRLIQVHEESGARHVHEASVLATRACIKGQFQFLMFLKFGVSLVLDRRSYDQ